MEDEQIIALYLKRDEQAVSETERAYGGYCFSVANNILCCHADAEEVVADTWMKAWNSIPPQHPKSLKLYLARITRNLALSTWRARSAGKRGGGQVLVALEELGDCVSGDGGVETKLNIQCGSGQIIGDVLYYYDSAAGNCLRSCNMGTGESKLLFENCGNFAIHEGCYLFVQHTLNRGWSILDLETGEKTHIAYPDN